MHTRKAVASPSNLAFAPKEKHIEILSKYTKGQLLEMRDRQVKLLSNKSRFMKLPDKGQRIQDLYDRLICEINARNEIDHAAALFSELNIAEKGIETVTRMEWHGGKHDEMVAAETLDSDDADSDHEVDPLRLLARSRNTVKLVKIVKPEKTLITEADLEEIKSFTDAVDEITDKLDDLDTNTKKSMSPQARPHKSNGELEPHAIYVCEKDKSFDPNSVVKKKFLPYKTTKSDVHSVEHEKERVKGKHWEITAATPPILRNSSAKLLTLRESIEMERQHKQKQQAQQEKQAHERLESRKKIIADNIGLLPAGAPLADPNAYFQSYRQRAEKDEDENHEAEDEENSDNSDDDDDSDRLGVSVVAYDNE